MHQIKTKNKYNYDIINNRIINYLLFWEDKLVIDNNIIDENNISKNNNKTIFRYY